MEGTRIEIKKGLNWIPLRLADNARIKYNAVINRIGKVNSREISHTNTFDLAPVWQNTNALDINTFNQKDLAKALNRKYKAKYYIEDKIVQSGFLVINNTKGGTIKVNFIDESLEITDIWGSTTYRQLLRDTTLAFPVDYQDAIDELFEYDMDKTSVLTPTNEVGTRGYHLCLFPNNLNAIGDEFQINEDDERLDDTFNPYQSRPIFNSVSLFDLATVAYGYTPIFDPSVDWDRVQRTYMVDKGLLESAKGNNGIQQVQYPTVSSAGTPFFVRTPDFLCTILCTNQVKHLFDFPPSRSVKPSDVENFSEPLLFGTYTGPPFNNPPSQPWLNQNVIFRPSVAAGNVGVINIKANTLVNNTNADFTSITFIGIWENITPGQPTVDTVLAERDTFGNITGPLVEVIPTTKTEFEVELDKAVLDTVPSGADPDKLVGISVVVNKTLMTSALFNMGQLITTETFLPEGVIAYDDFGQYLPDVVDLTHAAPNESIKSLLVGIMQKEGILMNIDNISREIKFFTYGAYEQQKIDGNFSDWSDYLQIYNPFLHNTNYGNNYAKINRIGLSSPYQGNTFDFILSNQGEDSKYKDFATNYVSVFKDVQNIKEILNSTTPYLEYENKGLGLVEFTGNLGQLTQVRADKTVQGTFTGLYRIENVNGFDLPNGVKEWYRLIDEASRVDAQYLVPVNVMRTLDISEPIFVEELGGFYIIEEVAEYVNSRKLVTVKLIKLIDDLRDLGIGPADPNNPPAPPSIVVSSSSSSPNGFTSFVYTMVNNITFFDYIPNSASIRARQLSTYSPGVTPDPSDYTGFEFNGPVTVPPYVNTFANFSGSLPLGSQEGWYEVQVTDGDDSSLVSNLEYVYLGDNTPPPPPSLSIYVDPGEVYGDGLASVLWGVNNTINPPTFIELVFQKATGGGLNGPFVPIGNEVVISLPTSPTTGVYELDVNAIGLPTSGTGTIIKLRSDIGETSGGISGIFPNPTFWVF